MAVNICLTDFRNAVKELVGNEGASSIINHLNDMSEKYMKIRNIPKAEAVGKSIDEFVADSKLEARMKQIQYKATALKMSVAEKQVEGFKDYSEGLAAFFTGTSVRGDMSRLSVAGNTKAVLFDVMGELKRKLDIEGATKDFEDKTLDDLNAKERAGEDTGNSRAKAVAKSIDHAFKYIIKKLNLEHVYIGNVEGYIAKTTHNVDRMLSATGTLGGDIAARAKATLNHVGDFHKITLDLHEQAYERWLRTIKPLTDNDKTFEHVKDGDEDKFFRGMFEHLTTGIRKDLPNAEESDLLRTQRRSYNKADKLSAPRVWHPKDADAWINYNKTYGHGSFHDTVISQLEQMSDSLGIIQKTGANPENFSRRLIGKFEKIVKRVQKPAGGDGRIRAVRRYVDYKLTPQTRTASGLGSKIVEGIKMTRYFQLGGLFVRSLPDTNTMALRMSKYEDNFATNSAKVAKAFLNGMPKGEAKDLAMALKLYADGSMGAQLSRFGNPDLGYGFMSKMLMLQDKLSLMNTWDNTGRLAVGKVISHKMATFVGDSYDKIPTNIKNELIKYGIDKDLWSLIGKNRKYLNSIGNERYFTPDAALSISKEDIARKWYKNKTGKTSNFKYDQAKNEIHNRLLNFFHDQVNYGKVFPNDSDYAYLKIITPNSPFLGGLIKILTMFKSFDLAMMRRTWGDFMYSEGGDSVWSNMYTRKADISKFLIGGLATGTLSYTAGEFLQGRVPDFSKMSTWAKIIVASSIAGMAGSFAESFFESRDSGDMLKSLSGAGVGATFNIVKDLKKILTFNKGSVPAFVNLIQHNSPFTSLFYVKPILDKYIIGALDDQFDPMHTEKKRSQIRRWAKESGDHLLWLPNR